MRRWLGIGNLTKQQILQLVAHRDPFLFVDYAIENKIGESVVAVKQLEKEDVPFFRHKQLEFMGQAGCILVKQVVVHCCKEMENILNMCLVSRIFGKFSRLCWNERRLLESGNIGARLYFIL